MVVVIEEEEGIEFHDLPEGCIENVLSFTTPQDVARLSLVSSTFKSAAESDSVWDKFLPADYRSIISQSETDVDDSLSVLSKKDLYVNLTQKPILIDGGKKSFQLDKVDGKKCYMLSARSLFIVWGDTPRYWKWISLPDSRFSEVAELVSVCWFEIRGWINTSMLSPQTSYGAYLVFKATGSGTYGFEYQPVEASIVIAGGDHVERNVFLDAERGRRLRYQIVPRRFRTGIFSRAPFVEAPVAPTESVEDMQKYPKDRPDGWLEMELGEFFNEGDDDKEMEIGVYEVKGGGWKGGLVVQGIEIRPKPKSC
ncbi:putative F-box protein PP2-B12 [Vicia villosa]|uniref:putative F-box protein PP2-B12 n=1 Tax=Vicia villosa TaxID=3911 RepID=UPI00273ABC3F|nr:putative F-box protein PP2-B12 [Vicia villosa]